jgi:polyhydroxyalkanoate synthase
VNDVTLRAVRYLSMPARTTFTALDHVRRLQGRALDALGLGLEQTPSDVLRTGPGYRVRSYRPPAGSAPPLLIVAAPIKRAYVWDLAPDVSTVRLLTDGGFHVHLLEWLDPGAAERDAGLAAYAGTFVGDAVDAVRASTGGAPLLAGHSLGGTLAAIFSALRPDLVRGAVLLEAPLRFGPAAGAFAPVVAAAPHAGWLRAGLGDVPGSFIDLVSASAAPRTFQVERYLDLLASLGHPSLRTHAQVERWSLDEFAVPGRLFEDIVEDLYRHDRFMRGELVLGESRVGPDTLTAPMLNVVNPSSAISPPAAVVQFHEAAASERKELLRYTGDRGVALQHVGVLVGRRARTLLWPRIVEWGLALPPSGRRPTGAGGSPDQRWTELMSG